VWIRHWNDSRVGHLLELISLERRYAHYTLTPATSCACCVCKSPRRLRGDNHEQTTCLVRNLSLLSLPTAPRLFQSLARPHRQMIGIHSFNYSRYGNTRHEFLLIDINTNCSLSLTLSAIKAPSHHLFPSFFPLNSPEQPTQPGRTRLSTHVLATLASPPPQCLPLSSPS
jgi:hypothetical protein